VLQEHIHEADDADIFRQTRNAGAQRADAANVQVNFDPGVRGLVERFDQIVVDQGIHFGADEARFSRRALERFAANHPQETAAHAVGRHIDFGPGRRL